MKKDKLILVVIAIFSFSVYINILTNNFVWDDTYFLFERSEIRDLGAVPSFFMSDVEGVYRPVRTVVYAISYHLFGKNPVGYHIQSILIHTLISLIVFFLIKNLTKNITLSFFSSLIFAVHPIHTESISFITTSFDTFAFIPMLLSLVLFLKSTDGNGKVIERKLYLISVFLAGVAFFSYEVTLSLPLLLVASDIFFRYRNPMLKSIKKQLKIYSPFFVVAAVYLMVRWYIVGIVVKRGFQPPFVYRMITMTKVFVDYLRLSIIPLDLNIMHEIELSKSLMEPSVVFSLFLIILILSVIGITYKRNRIISFSLVWFFVSLIPVSNIIPIGTLMAERYLYLPSVGTSLIIAFIILSAQNSKFIQKEYKNLVLIFLLITVALSFSILTIFRNNDWRDNITLWNKTVSQSPNEPKAHYNLGYEYMKMGFFSKAIGEYNKTIRLDPNFSKAYHNLGWIFYQWGKMEEAEEMFKKAIKTNPKKSHYSYFMLGQIYSNKNLTKAMEFYKKAIEVKPKYAEAHRNLGIAYALQGDYENAVRELKKSIEIDPKLADAHNYLGVVYIYIKEYYFAEKEFEKALNLDPKNEEYRKNLENLKILMMNA